MDLDGLTLRWFLVALPALSAPALSAPALAQQPGSAQHLVANLPVQVQDALSIRLGEFQLQGATRADPHAWAIGPAVRYGVTDHLQVLVGADYASPAPGQAGTGAGTVAGFYQLTDNTVFLPAVAVSGAYQAPLGAGRGTDLYEGKLIATKYLGTGATAPRLHLNLVWDHRDTPGPAIRSDQLGFGAAWSMQASATTAVVIDYVHGAMPTKAEEENIIDLGVRHLIGNSLAISLGGGVGIGPWSPNFRVFLGVQKAFQFF